MVLGNSNGAVVAVGGQESDGTVLLLLVLLLLGAVLGANTEQREREKCMGLGRELNEYLS